MALETATRAPAVTRSCQFPTFEKRMKSPMRHSFLSATVCREYCASRCTLLH
jgi:hypothetical protein